MALETILDCFVRVCYSMYASMVLFSPINPSYASMVSSFFSTILEAGYWP